MLFLDMAGTSKSGKTKGAGSFVRISLSELNRCLKPEASVIVNRRYVEALNMEASSFQANTIALKNVVKHSAVATIDEKERIQVEVKTDW
jgi:hypothetical protein